MANITRLSFVAVLVVSCCAFSNPSIPSLDNLIPTIPSKAVDPEVPKVPDVPAIPSISEISSIVNIAEAQRNYSEYLDKVAATVFNVEAVQKKYKEYLKTVPQAILDDAEALVPELVERRGYPIETHKVITPDGYILAMHRIPYGKSGPSENRPVVYLQHGILSSSADWVIPIPEKALAYILADAGYDVWLPNVRGTRYSRNHQTLDPDGAKFWDFCWHDIAINDVTTMIDYALNKTKQKNLYYIGHSQGTTVFYVMCSEKPEYNNKIRAMFSLAPIAYMNHMTSPLLQIISRGEIGIGVLTSVIGLNEFLPTSKFLAQVGHILCSDDSITQILCTNSLFAVCGFNHQQMNTTLLPIIMGHTPAGAAIKQLFHYAQEITSGKFRYWDLGFFGNNMKYSSNEPPKYQLNNVKAPVYLHYSKNDWLSHETDVIRLYNELGNVKAKLLVPDKKFNHVDYLYGKDARELVYDAVLALMKQH